MPSRMGCESKYFVELGRGEGEVKKLNFCKVIASDFGDHVEICSVKKYFKKSLIGTTVAVVQNILM